MGIYEYIICENLLFYKKEVIEKKLKLIKNQKKIKVRKNLLTCKYQEGFSFYLLSVRRDVLAQL